LSDSTWDSAPLAPGPEAEPEFTGGFVSFADRLDNEREDRIERGKRILSFGVKFLDKALGGIFLQDLVLIGAATGLGKTALASRAALVNAKAGKRVHYFALEAEKLELERRLKFQLLAEIVKREAAAKRVRLNFLEWYTGALDHLTGPYEASADRALKQAFKTLHTFYRDREFYAKQFVKMVKDIEAETDLIVLDHLHYVDSTDENENRGLRTVVKRVRDVALSIGKPVIMVAHVRKADRRNARLVPTVEDFMGTSDIPKIATKAVMIAPAYDQSSGSTLLWPTYIAPVKCRFDSTRTRFVGLCSYDLRAGAYEDDFILGKLNPAGSEFELVRDENAPDWAREHHEA
jgi:archaellum biogenesis ATPase FlaH